MESVDRMLDIDFDTMTSSNLRNESKFHKEEGAWFSA